MRQRLQATLAWDSRPPRLQPTATGRSQWARLAALLVAALAMAACGREVVDYDGLYLSVSSEKTDAPVTLLSFDVAKVAPDAASLLKPASSGDGKFQVTLPPGLDLQKTAFRVQISPSKDWTGKVTLRILGRDSAGGIRATWFGEINTATKAEQAIRLTAVSSAAHLECDKDGDGVPACKPECKATAPLCDCDDDPTPDAAMGGVPKGARSSPFLVEDACLDAGNGIDEDCHGGDATALDSDGDKDPDCVEQKQCPTVDGLAPEKNPKIYHGATEICDGVDNNCDGKIDEGQTYIDIDGTTKTGMAKGDACGTGACEKDPTGKHGEVVCSADAKTLVCSTASQKKAEDCANKIDDDCNGQVDEGCEADDLDGDGASNGAEDKCKYKFAKFHSEYNPNISAADEKCCPGGKDCSGAAGEWDFNCDGVIVPCKADDPDGDGKIGALDCAPNDPDVYVGAKQACGDGKGPCPADGDVPCSDDKDGDKYNGDVDCDNGDPNVHPFATEVCNGKDDDCDGLIDEGNPGGEDKQCGDPDGDCGTIKGTSVCKHFVAKDASFKPGELECLSSPYTPLGDGKLGYCVGCFGDKRPEKETCDDHDQDCDGQTDEDFPYQEESTKKTLLWGEACDGVGNCGSGIVQCANLAKAICSSDPGGKIDGAKAEVCNNQDDNCNGKTDELLTSVSDSKCEKVGVCGGGVGNISTVCVAGIWRCDYSKVAKVEFQKTKSCAPGSPSCQCDSTDPQSKPTCYMMAETSCDGEDNDCDGQTDEDFDFADWDGKSLKITQTCGTGACTGGKVVCLGGANGNGKLDCTTLTKISKEKCNGSDDDCDGKTDELSDMPVTDSTCLLVGVCNPDNVGYSCPSGKWVCDYAKVQNYEDAKEVTCDGLDNDCDGKTDEDFEFADFDGSIRHVGDTCGTGLCAGGKTVCTGDKKGLTCGSLGNKKTDICNTVDDDCDGKTDEDYLYTQEGGAKLGVTQACDGIGQCGIGAVECTPGKTDQATCSTDPNGSQHADSLEKCNDVDDDCDGQTDEGCNLDNDLFCTALMITEGTPKVCPKGGGDCVDDPTKSLGANQIFPSASELCDGIDNNCTGSTDEIFKYTEPNGVALGVGASCGLGECAAAKSVVTCDPGKLKAVCLGYVPQTEVCDGKDNDCDGAVDEGCDDDGDKYCDVAMKVYGKPATCPLTVIAKDGDPGDDCNDDQTKNGKNVNPGVIEACDDVDNNCQNGTDEGCDDDKDGYCDIKMETASLTPQICPKTKALFGKGDDCNDNVKDISPAGIEICDDVDNNCAAGTDEGCDDDKDGYCDSALPLVGKPAICTKTASVSGKGDDCDDKVAAINPGATELCDNIDNDCKSGVDEGCDTDGDLYCDGTMKVYGKPTICPKTNVADGSSGDDCNDSIKDINPGAVELCDDLDNNCSLTTDEGCDDDKDGYCDAAMTVVGKPAVCKNTVGGKGDDCNDDPTKGGANFSPAIGELCNNLDDNCDGKTDEGCDDDKDGYCDATMKVYGKPTICPSTSVAKDGDPGNDCQDDPLKNGFAINPGKTEQCGSAGVDDNCNGKTDEEGAFGCTNLYYDSDLDGYGAGTAKCLCKPGDILGFTAIQGGDCVDTGVSGGVPAAQINPGAKEQCNTPSVDENCNNNLNDVGATGCVNFYGDLDGDTFGAGTAKCLCVADVPTKFTTKDNTDCNDDPTKGGAAVNPAAAEACNDIDDNCAGGTDEGCDDDNDDYCGSDMALVGKPKACPLSVAVNGMGDDCNDVLNANGANVHPNQTEACNDVDDNCDTKVDEGCDDDKDSYCDATMNVVGTPKICPLTSASGGKGDDCIDNPAAGGAAVHPKATEICNDIDDNCTTGTDEGCDDDGDKYCGSDMGLVGKPKVCPNSTAIAGMGDDCNDVVSANGANIHPGATETCNDVDDNCTAGTDEGCDDDGDGYCDIKMTVFNKPKICPNNGSGGANGKLGDDCNDDKTLGAAINPSKTEVCNDVDDNCAGGADEGCDDDNDDYCDANMTVYNKPLTCTKTDGGLLGTKGNDCEDAVGKQAINPGATEVCDGIDNNCDTKIDDMLAVPSTCPGVNFNFGVCKDAGVAKVAKCQGVSGWFCDYSAIDLYTAATVETGYCGDSKDNNCDGKTDEGCP